MSSNIRRLQANTRERILSTDWNNATALHHRALIEAGAALLQGDASIYGVVRGLTVSTTGGILLVRVAAGLALRSGTAPTTYDSNTQWIELRSATDVDLTALVDGANPRWVVIEIAEASAVEISEARDIFDPVTGTFSSASVTKVTGSSPTLTARAGTAAANPIFPSGIAGVIPLAYVYLGAGTAAIGVTDIVMCRPMLRGDVGGDQSASQRDVWGGGVSVATAGLATVLRNAGGRFAGHRAQWGIQAADGTTAFTLAAPSCDGAALPVGDDVLYFYACPAPYPSGYDTNLAPREHRPGATALTRYQGMVSADLYNAVLVVSTVEPQADSPQGSPTAGNFTMTCAPFAAAATIDRTTVVYLGAGFYDTGTPGFLAQACFGAGLVTWTQSATTNLPSEADLRNSAASGTLAGDAWVANPLTGTGTQIVPSSASEALLYFNHVAAATAQWNAGIGDTSGPTGISYALEGASFITNTVWVRTRTFSWSHSEAAGANATLTVTTRGYRDGALAQR